MVSTGYNLLPVHFCGGGRFSTGGNSSPVARFGGFRFSVGEDLSPTGERGSGRISVGYILLPTDGLPVVGGPKPEPAGILVEPSGNSGLLPRLISAALSGLGTKVGRATQGGAALGPGLSSCAPLGLGRGRSFRDSSGRCGEFRFVFRLVFQIPHFTVGIDVAGGGDWINLPVVAAKFSVKNERGRGTAEVE
jgi:hypothetical protein